jgi:mono/diheme cytochrome c family protein
LAATLDRSLASSVNRISHMVLLQTLFNIGGKPSRVFPVMALVGCSVAQLGASDADLESAKSQAFQGAVIFEEQCASCHGKRGEGGAAPAILGRGALPRYPRADSVDPAAGQPAVQQVPSRAPTPEIGRPEFVSALSLERYLEYHMPKGVHGRTLSEDDYWAVVNFMLLAHGADVPSEGIASTNAASVKLERHHE